MVCAYPFTDGSVLAVLPSVAQSMTMTQKELRIFALTSYTVTPPEA